MKRIITCLLLCSLLLTCLFSMTACRDAEDISKTAQALVYNGYDLDIEHERAYGIVWTHLGAQLASEHIEILYFDNEEDAALFLTKDEDAPLLTQDGSILYYTTAAAKEIAFESKVGKASKQSLEGAVLAFIDEDFDDIEVFKKDNYRAIFAEKEVGTNLWEVMGVAYFETEEEAAAHAATLISEMNEVNNNTASPLKVERVGTVVYYGSENSFKIVK